MEVPAPHGRTACHFLYIVYQAAIPSDLGRLGLLRSYCQTLSVKWACFLGSCGTKIRKWICFLRFTCHGALELASKHFLTPFVSRTKKRRQWQGQQDNNKTITTPTNTTANTNRNVNLYNNFKYTSKIHMNSVNLGSRQSWSDWGLDIEEIPVAMLCSPLRGSPGTGKVKLPKGLQSHGHCGTAWFSHLRFAPWPSMTIHDLCLLCCFMRDKVRPFQYLLCCCISFGIFCENAGASRLFGCHCYPPNFHLPDPEHCIARLWVLNWWIKMSRCPVLGFVDLFESLGFEIPWWFFAMPPGPVKNQDMDVG